MHLASSAIVQKWKGPFELRLLETLFVPLVSRDFPCYSYYPLSDI